ncbi:Uncharacterised protein [Nocardia africana]|uniref:Uncharacterized protein n=2 Tax=Nocardia africana TaxID=134964 RepID=A0A378WWC7_9NOCA|nr:Uncharacterised protein [Nocardia africana]
MSANPLILRIDAPGHVEERKLNTGPPAQPPDGAPLRTSSPKFAAAFVPALLLLGCYKRPSTGGIAD